MKKLSVLRLFVALVVLALGGKARAQTFAEPFLLEGVDLRRLERLRPLQPFDADGGYRLLDAWQTKPKEASPVEKSWGSRTLLPALIGTEIKLSPRWMLGLDGLVHVFSQHNPIDGSWLGYELIGGYEIGAGRRLVLRAGNHFTTRSRQWMSENHALLFYAPDLGGTLVLSGGVTSRGTVHVSNEEQLAQVFPGLIGANSSLDTYRRTYLSLRNSIYPLARMRVNLLALYEHRVAQMAALSTHRALIGEISAYYDLGDRAPRSGVFPTPMQRPHGYFAPEVGVSYRVALDPANSARSFPFSRYQILELSLRGAYAWDDANNVKWGITAGKYLARGRTTPADERYMPTGSALGRTPITGTWATIDNSYYAGEKWLWGFADYSAGRWILGKWIGYELDEALHARVLLGSGSRRWWELGYSIGWGELLRLGVFAGGDLRNDYRMQIRLSVPLLLLTSHSSTRY